MKTYTLNIKILALLLAIIFYSCSKDQITVEKNSSTSWEIDKKIIDEDIRIRIGNNFAKTLIYFEQKSINSEFIKIGDNILGLHHQQVSIKIFLSKKYKEDVKATLKLNSDKTQKYLWENKHIGFQILSEKDVTLSDTEITIPAGELSKEVIVTLPQSLTSANLVAVYDLILNTQKDDLIVIPSRSDITLALIETTNNLESSYQRTPERGTRIDGKTITANFTKGGTRISRFVDNNNYNYATLNLVDYPDNGLNFDFGREVTITAIRFTPHHIFYQHLYAKALKVLVDNQEIGNVAFENKADSYMITLKKPMKLSSITMTDFVKADERANGVVFAEISFYEE